MLLQLLSRQDRRHSWLALWLVLYVLWFNMHGGFLVGFGLFVVYTAERIVRSWRVHGSLARAVKESRALVLASAAMTVLPVLSPFGTAYYAYLWHAVGMPRPIIAEWQPLWSQQYPEVLLCFGVSLGLVAYAVAARGIGRLPELSLLLAPAWLALEHTRHLPIYAVVWMCLAPAWIAPTRLGGEVEKLWRNQAPILVVFWLVLGLMSLVYAGENRFWRLRIPTSPAEASEGIPIYPAGAVDYLDAHGFSGNLMVPFDAGSYVSWKLHPAVRVSLDSRYEVAYPPQAAEEAVRFFAAADGWQSTLSRYPTDAVLVPWWSALNGLLEASVSGEAGAFHWQCVYRDDAYAIYMPEPRAKQYPVVDRRGEVIAASFP